MGATQGFQNLELWQKAHQCVLGNYRLASRFPKEERYALGDQLRRASVSIAANIAEGYRRTTSADKARFFDMALSSSDEVQYYLILARDLGYSDTADLLLQIDEVQRMLNAYVRAIRSRAH